MKDVIVKVENCYFPVDFIIVDMKSMKDFTDSPIILWRPFLATAKAITNWGKAEVIFQVRDSTMKVSINKLMRHPSHESDEVGAVDIYEDPEISSCIKETMVGIEGKSFEEPEDDPFPSGEMAPELKPLPSTLNPKVWDVVKDEILKWLKGGIIYPIFDSPWVSLVHVVPKKAGITMTTNGKGEEIQTRLPTKWRVCIDYWKLNATTEKDHFPLPFIDQILDNL